MPDTQIIAENYYQLGRKHRIDGEYDEAIGRLLLAIDEDPNMELAHMELGLAYCFIGDFDASIRELELAAGLAPYNADISLNLAKTYTMLGMFPEGKEAFTCVLNICKPGDINYEEAVKQLCYFT